MDNHTEMDRETYESVATKLCRDPQMLIQRVADLLMHAETLLFGPDGKRRSVSNQDRNWIDGACHVADVWSFLAATLVGPDNDEHPPSGGSL